MDDLARTRGHAENDGVTSALAHARKGADMFRNWFKNETDSPEDSRYGEELLCANWNPVIELVARSCSVTREHASRDVPARGEIDIEGFLNRVYTLGA